MYSNEIEEPKTVGPYNADVPQKIGEVEMLIEDIDVALSHLDKEILNLCGRLKNVVPQELTTSSDSNSIKEDSVVRRTSQGQKLDGLLYRIRLETRALIELRSSLEN